MSRRGTTCSYEPDSGLLKRLIWAHPLPPMGKRRGTAGMAAALASGDRRIDLSGVSEFQLGAARVCPALLQIRCDANTEAMEPRVMQMLVSLHRARGAPVARDDLIALCWGGFAVSDDAINQCVPKLRRALASVTDLQVLSVPRVG